MIRKLLIILFAAALAVAGAVTVMAQEDDDGTTFPFGHGRMHQEREHHEFGHGMMQGHGSMMGGGFGPGMMWNDDHPMMFAVAEALGLEPDALVDAVHNGQTLAEIAEEQGVELETVYAVMLTTAEEHMASLVEEGTITQDQADEHLAWMRENVDEMPMFSGSGFGPCMDGSFGVGMMRQARGVGR